jgi:hypothetical protein
MKSAIILLASISLMLCACETEYKFYNPDSPNPENILTESPVEYVSYPDTVLLDKGGNFKVRLSDGFPCYSFLRFETEKIGNEYFITAKVNQSAKLCDSTVVKIERPYTFEPDDTGLTLLHFYQNGEDYYHIQVTVIE